MLDMLPHAFSNAGLYIVQHWLMIFAGQKIEKQLKDGLSSKMLDAWSPYVYTTNTQTDRVTFVLLEVANFQLLLQKSQGI